MTTAPKTRTCRACDHPFEAENPNAAYCPRCIVGRDVHRKPLLRASCSVCGTAVVRRAHYVLAARRGDHRLACNACFSQINAETGARNGARNGAKSALPSTVALRAIHHAMQSGEDPTDEINHFLAAYTEEAEGGCRLWTGPLDDKGYPRRAWIDGKRITPFHLIYEAMSGDSRGAREPIHHTYGEPRCMIHLEKATNNTNTAEMMARRSFERKIAAARSLLSRALTGHAAPMTDDLRAAAEDFLGLTTGDIALPGYSLVARDEDRAAA